MGTYLKNRFFFVAHDTPSESARQFISAEILY
jgi:hypothetical protein